MSQVSIEAMKNRNGWDTHYGIPRKLKSLAYDLWGRDPKQCALCGSSQNPHLHHCADLRDRVSEEAMFGIDTALESLTRARNRFPTDQLPNDTGPDAAPAPQP